MKKNIDISAVFGMTPEGAVNFFESKGYRFSWNWYDTWQEAHAKAFTVAKAMKMDLLKDIRESVDDAIKNGVAFNEFRKNLEPKLRARGWWGRKLDKSGKAYWAGTPSRLKLIYNQNLHTSYMAGRYQSLAGAVKERPYWQYIAVRDDRTRPTHLELAGKIIRYDDPFWDYYYPPNGFNCRCTVRSLAKGDLNSAGFRINQAEDGQITVRPEKGKISSPEIRWKNEIVGGKTVKVPHGIDPGFAYHPGKAAWQPDLNQYPYALAREYLNGAITGPDFKRFFEGKIEGNFPVAVLPKNLKQMIGSSSQTVLFSSESLAKNKAHHPELKLSEYQKLPNIISENASTIIKDGGLNIVFISLDNIYYQAVVKSTQSGSLSLTSAMRTTAPKSEIARLKRKAGTKVIKDISRKND